VFHGRKLSEFTVDLVLSEDADWDAWNAWKHLVLAPPSEIQSDPNSILRPTAIRPRALDIEHPILADLGIRSVVIENCSQPEQTADGQWTISIKMLEFHRPHFTVARPTGSAATPVDPVDAQIEGLTRQVQALSGESGDSH
jgi:hypothetical protein